MQTGSLLYKNIQIFYVSKQAEDFPSEWTKFDMCRDTRSITFIACYEFIQLNM